MTGEVIATSDTREGAESFKRQYRDLVVSMGYARTDGVFIERLRTFGGQTWALCVGRHDEH